MKFYIITIFYLVLNLKSIKKSNNIIEQIEKEANQIEYPRNCNRNQTYTEFTSIDKITYLSNKNILNITNSIYKNYIDNFSFIPYGFKYIEELKKFIISVDFNKKIKFLISKKNVKKCEAYENINILQNIPLKFNYTNSFYLNYFNFRKFYHVEKVMIKLVNILNYEKYGNKKYKKANKELKLLTESNGKLLKLKNKFLNILRKFIKFVNNIDYTNSEINKKVDFLNYIIKLDNNVRINDKNLKLVKFLFEFINTNIAKIQTKLNNIKKILIEIDKVKNEFDNYKLKILNLIKAVNNNKSISNIFSKNIYLIFFKL